MKCIIMPMTCTELSDADLRDMLCIGGMKLHNLSAMNDVRTGFGLGPDLNLLTVVLKISDVILMHV